MRDPTWYEGEEGHLIFAWKFVNIIKYGTKIFIGHFKNHNSKNKLSKYKKEEIKFGAMFRYFRFLFECVDVGKLILTVFHKFYKAWGGEGGQKARRKLEKP